jgi:hypothetical protein
MHVEQGATFALAVTLTDENGDAVDLTGYSGRGQIRSATGAAMASFTVTVTDAPAGEVSITLPASALVGSQYITGVAYNDYTTAYYDIELYTAADASVLRILNGVCRISPEATHP